MTRPLSSRVTVTTTKGIAPAVVLWIKPSHWSAPWVLMEMTPAEAGEIAEQLRQRAASARAAA